MKNQKPLFLIITVLVLAGLLTSCSKLYDVYLTKLEKEFYNLELNYQVYDSYEMQEKIDLFDEQFNKICKKETKLTQAQQLRLSKLKGKYHRLLLEIKHFILANDYDNEELIEDINDKLGFLDVDISDLDDDVEDSASDLNNADKAKDLEDNNSSSAKNSYYDDDDDILSSISLEEIVEVANEDLPETIDEGLIMTKIVIEGNYLVYICSVDEDEYDIDMIRESKNEVKNAIKKDLLNPNDSDIQYTRRMCKKYHKGIAYRYVGRDSRDSYTIYISSKEL